MRLTPELPAAATATTPDVLLNDLNPGQRVDAGGESPLASTHLRHGIERGRWHRHVASRTWQHVAPGWPYGQASTQR